MKMLDLPEQLDTFIHEGKVGRPYKKSLRSPSAALGIDSATKNLRCLHFTNVVLHGEILDFSPYRAQNNSPSLFR